MLNLSDMTFFHLHNEGYFIHKTIEHKFSL